jgi:16S rRNA (uracil1498-N3)-methyltransferase
VTPPLFLLDELPAADELLLNGEEGRHAARVMRLRTGEELLVSDGQGGLLRCKIREVVGDALRLGVLSREHIPAPDPRLVVVQGLPKGERAELAVETMTELGVDMIVPWSAARSVRQWRGARGEKAVQRWRRTAREAAKQSRRTWIPAITGPVDGPAAVARVRAANCALVLHEDGERRLADVPMPGSGDVLVVVGPEGGISPEEIAAFEDAAAVTVRLGAAVLRTSTAGPAALAALSLRLGRWG